MFPKHSSGRPRRCLRGRSSSIQLIRHFVEGHVLLANQEFADGLTIAEYLALDDEQEATLWDRWYTEADREVGHIIAEASPDALPPR